MSVVKKAFRNQLLGGLGRWKLSINKSQLFVFDNFQGLNISIPAPNFSGFLYFLLVLNRHNQRCMSDTYTETTLVLLFSGVGRL